MFGLDLHPPEQGRGVTEPCMLCITIQGITVTTDSDFRLFFLYEKRTTPLLPIKAIFL